jgi:hypothetical protein
MFRQVDAESAAGKLDSWGQKGLIPVNGLRAVCLAGYATDPRVRATVRWLTAHPDVWLNKTCPWGATFVLKSLWYARGTEDTATGIHAAVAWIDSHMNASGCVKYWDPYAVVGAVGLVDLPEARAVLLRELPMLLRGQEANGGWGDNKWDLQTVDVFRALKTHGLLDELRKLPPLPPDWRVARSIPAPKGELGYLCWLGGRLWVSTGASGELLALSPEDGSVLKRLKIPNVIPVGLGLWDGSLAVTQKDPKRVLKVNPDTGAVEAEIGVGFAASPMCSTMVNGKLWIPDGWLFPGWILDPARPEKVPVNKPGEDFDPSFRLERLLAGTCPNALAATDDGVWHTDYFARTLIKSNFRGKLADWAERPFGGTSGIAWDGRNLWAIDNAGGRICVMERTESGGK